MSMKSCKECGRSVSSKAEICPHCGVVVKKKLTSLDQLVHAIVFCVAIYLFCAFMGWLMRGY